MTSPWTLRILCDSQEIALPYEEGQTLRQALEYGELRPTLACSGNGSCGLCRVQIVEGGRPYPPTTAELLSLDHDALRAGVRLACQTRLRAPATVRILDPASHTDWKAPVPGSLFTRPSATPRWGGWNPMCQHPLGLAVDLGTTHLTISAVDLTSGQRLGARQGPNPQRRYGVDILSRVQSAAENRGTWQALQSCLLEALGQGFRELCLAEGLNPSHFRRVCLVGNTAMSALLVGEKLADLLHPAQWSVPLILPAPSPDLLQQAWEFPPECEVLWPPSLGGFVGSDALAGALATGLIVEGTPSMLLDFGTNTEILLWDGSVLWTASSAGGPAFEGVGIRCGRPARPGAIYRVEPTEEAPPGRPLRRDQKLQWKCLPGAPAEGICGSGLVDLLACWRRQGILQANGRFTPGEESPRLEIEPGRFLDLSWQEVDLLQRAKAAVGAGIDILLDRAGLARTQLSRVFLSGAFGRHLSIESAISIGLLPDLPASVYELCGNTAVAGAEALLLSEKRANPVASEPVEISDDTFHCRVAGWPQEWPLRPVDLATRHDFPDHFLDNLFLSPR